jgi:hypothetical protein
VLAQTQRERDDRERRIGLTRSREDRAPGDVEIPDAMDAAIRIDDAGDAVRAHARRPEVMPAVSAVVQYLELD